MLNTLTNTNSTPREQSFVDAGQRVKDSLEPPQTITEELPIHISHFATLRNIQISEPLSLAENEDSMTSTALTPESIDEGMARHEFQSPGMS